MAGYSGTPILKKLGLKEGMHIRIDGARPGYETYLGGFPEGVKRARKDLDFVHLFVTSPAGLDEKLAKIRSVLVPTGMVWISWPKKTSKLSSSIDREAVRTIGLACQMVDVKVCAFDDDWSALKFVIPLKDRPSAPAG